MLIITGAAGFIGQRLTDRLAKDYAEPILAVDKIHDGHRFQALCHPAIMDYLDKDDFLRRIQKKEHFSGQIKAIVHQGACTDTTEWDGVYMMANNYEYSKQLLHYALEYHIPFLYASSAAVYGQNACCEENPIYEQPLNVYGYSKLLFDRYVRRQLPSARSPVVGLRYFNVYGPDESHKGHMASVIYHFHKQLLETGSLSLFKGTDGFEDGAQIRDFVHVDDIAAVNSWFLNHPECSDLFNCGTGQGRSFNALANLILQWHQKGQIRYIPFPEHLKGHYQSKTEANIESLRAAGYTQAFMALEQGIPAYLDALTT